MTTLLFILAYVVGPLLMAFAVILIQRQLKRRKRGVPPVKDSEVAPQERERD